MVSVTQNTREAAPQENLPQLVLEGSGDGIWDWNCETGRCWFSPRFRELLGLAGEDTASLPEEIESLTRYAGEVDATRISGALEKHLREGAPFDLVCRLAHREEGRRSFRLRGKLLRFEDSRPRRMTGSLSDISHITAVEEELTRAAMLDRLTGLPNRSLLLERVRKALVRARENGELFAVMFLDFDRFKIINDSLGHDVGDALLCEIADRLRRELRFTDTVCRDSSGPSAARMGGDEFVVLLDRIRQPGDVEAVAERLLRAFARTFTVGSHEVFVTASIGIVVGCGEYGRAEDVIRDADTAMYEAKRAGRARYAVFDAAMRRRIQRHHALELDLRRAIAGNQLSLAYQPIVCLETGDIKSVEALLRWQHPVEGPISPAEFIPIAEESNLILSLSEWVFEEGMKQMAEWVERLGPSAPQTVSLNLSRKQFAQADLADRIATIARRNALAPERIQLEVTEDFFASDVNAAIATMNAIKRHGMHLAIDDFGTGCSSFAALHQFPADVLKIDRSMLTNIEKSKETAALVHSLSILVRNLGMSIVAEGIETESQVIILQELGCRFGQGFYFARPLTPAAFEEYALRHGSASGTVSGAAAFQDRWAELAEQLHLELPAHLPSD